MAKQRRITNSRPSTAASTSATAAIPMGSSPSPGPHPAGGQIFPVTSVSRTQVQRAALVASVSGRSFEDVKFFLFSRRARTGRVDTPLPLLANGALIRKAAPHFAFLELGAGYAESAVVDLDAPYPSTRPFSIDSYEYESDSDLEDEEGEEEAMSYGIPDDSTVIGPSPNPSKSPDDDSEKKDDDKDGNVDHVKNEIIKKPGRIVYLPDFAYATWKAFIIWTYLEELNFAPLRSQQNLRPSEDESAGAPLCSPKSMYRLAHRYDIPSLREAAADDIKAKLSPHNILEELFSSFTSLYPDIQAIELDYLHTKINDPGIRARLPTWLERMEDGRLPKGAASIIASLIVKFTSPASLKTCPRRCGSSVSYYCNSCGNTFT